MRIKKSKSILRQVILFPASVTLFILLAAISLCFFSIHILDKRSVENVMNGLHIAVNQLQNELGQIDEAFLKYWNQSDSCGYLTRIDSRKPVDMFLEYQLETVDWMNHMVGLYHMVSGAFVYYENIDLMLFRGMADQSIHEYIVKRLKNVEGECNVWELVTVAGEQYLITIKHYGSFYGGVWLPASKMDSKKMFGEGYSFTYLMDASMENTVPDPKLGALLKLKGFEENIRAEGKSYHNYRVEAPDQRLYLGILISDRYFWEDIPLPVKGIFLLLGICVLLFPMVILWLRRRIVRPIQILDTAMKAAGEGDLDYRIREIVPGRPNELERLMNGFNRMMEEINTLSVSLYKTKIREQKIKLKYISQMIQPHFVLNALNIMYTYRENEFGLMKKMIRYLMEYFRYVVYLRADFVTLSQEMRHIENYLNIQKERYMDAFDFFVEWESGVSDCHIPPLIIQTFAENCLKYGKRCDEPMFVYVLANEQDGLLKLVIADSGNGFSGEVLEKIETFIKTREYCDDLGIGIQNAIERMDILYGKHVDVHIHNALYGGAVVELFLPLSAG